MYHGVAIILTDICTANFVVLQKDRHNPIEACRFRYSLFCTQIKDEEISYDALIRGLNEKLDNSYVQKIIAARPKDLFSMVIRPPYLQQIMQPTYFITVFEARLPFEELKSFNCSNKENIHIINRKSILRLPFVFGLEKVIEQYDQQVILSS